MTIDNLTTTVEGLRNQALAAKGAFNADRAAIMGDARLTPIGRREALDELRASTNATLAKLGSAETEAIDAALLATRRKIAGTVAGNEDIISFRDAQDRADSLTDARDAARIMDRALLTGDKPLAAAVMGRAVSEGWRDVTDRYAQDNPASAMDYNDQAEIVAFRDNLQQVFQRGAHYATV